MLDSLIQTDLKSSLSFRVVLHSRSNVTKEDGYFENKQLLGSK